MKYQLKIGDKFEGVLLETIKGKSTSRPRVRPLEYFDQEIRVEFPRNLREDNPIGTRFRADVKVSQKTKNGEPWGRAYLVAIVSTIEKIDYKPLKSIQAIKLNTASDRAYEYIEKEFKSEPNLVKFSEFRERAYKNSLTKPDSIESTKRSDIIKTYALSRANGKCELCDEDAPFLKNNGRPYLEFYHIVELSKSGSDSPKNVAALCPYCHSNVTDGQDARKFNNRLKHKIEEREKELSE